MNQVKQKLGKLLKIQDARRNGAFKMQMAYIDSLQNPRPRTPQKQDEKPKEKAIEVVKAKNPAEVYFNTVGKNKKLH